MKEKGVLRYLYDLTLNHWIFTTFFIFSPTILLFFFIRNINYSLSAKGLENVLSIFFYFSILFFLIALLKFYGDKYNNLVKDNGLIVLSIILQSLNLGKRRKLNRFYKFIIDTKKHSVENPFYEITQPQKQIKVILDNIQNTFSRLFGIDPNDIGLSVIFKTDKHETWEWAAHLNIENDLQLQSLVNNKNSTAFQIISGHDKYLFYPDKRKGLKEGKFSPGPIDETKDSIGSIICKDIGLDQNNNLLNAVLSITTYGKQLCDEYDIESKSKIEEILLPSFEYRIKVELALLYIKNHIA